MITLYQKQDIVLMYYRDGISQRGIARNTGLDRKTVRRYLDEYEKKRSELAKASNPHNTRELIEAIVENPKYSSLNRTKRKLTDEIITKIKKYLDENERKRKNGQRKQQMKMVDIFEALREHGYDISYGTVRNAIIELSGKKKEAFIKTEYQLGDICEFDWGEVKIYIDEELRHFQLAVFATAKGNYRYARLFAKQDTPSFQEAHAMFFEKIQGAYRTLVYDNTKVAIKRFVGINEKEPTEALIKLSMYYGFKPRFCNIKSPNEKGHVERSVEYIRRKAFALRDHFKTIQEANEYLEKVCNDLNSKPQKLNNNRTAYQILEEERPELLPNMPKFEASRTVDARVDKYSTIIVDSCHYSVPEMYVGKMIFVKVYSDEIICFYEGTKIAHHKRKLGFNEWNVNIEHYLETLRKKPGALAHSLAMHQTSSKLQTIYKKYYTKKEKEFVELLLFIKEKSLEKIEEALKLLERLSPIDISTEKIKTICNRNISLNEKAITNSEIAVQSKEMLSRFKQLIPSSEEKFNEEVAII